MRETSQKQMFFVKNKKWKHVLNLLYEKVNCSELNSLYDTKWILKEWRYEPESWIYMLTHEPKNIQEILRECDSCSLKICDVQSVS